MVSFVPKVIPGGKFTDEKADHQVSAQLGYVEIIDINRLSQAFFKIQSTEIRQRVIAFIEEIAETEYLESRS